MQTWAIVLIVAAGILAGFFIGLIFQKIRKRKERAIGNLIVADAEDGKEPPYIYLELHKDVDTIYSQKSVEFNVKHISHK